MSDHHRSDGTMSIARFAAILDAYGAGPRRWPARERAAATELLVTSAEARALRDEAAQLDGLLTGSVAPMPSAALRAAILQAAPRRPSAEAAGLTESLGGLWQALLGTLTGELGGLRPAGVVLGLALLLGIAAGGTVATRSNETSTTVTAAQGVDFTQLALFDDPYAEY